MCNSPGWRIGFTDNGNQLGVFDPSGCPNAGNICHGKVWQFPDLGSDQDKINIGSIAFDSQGKIWVGDFAGTITRLYRTAQLDTTHLEYCPFDIGYYHTHDLKFHDGAIWFGDYYNHRIQRFEPTGSTTGNLSYWQLPTDADPDGMAFDADGGLWWMEINAARIGHLSFGATNMLTYYQIPGMAHPISISILSMKIWYSDQNGKVGQLDTISAVPINSTAITAEPAVSKNTECIQLSQTLTYGAEYYENKPLTFATFAPPLIPDTSTPGWTIYTLPAGSKPAGIAALGNQVYVADSNASVANSGKLIRFTIPEGQYNVFLPLILR